MKETIAGERKMRIAKSPVRDTHTGAMKKVCSRIDDNGLQEER